MKLFLDFLRIYSGHKQPYIGRFYTTGRIIRPDG